MVDQETPSLPSIALAEAEAFAFDLEKAADRVLGSAPLAIRLREISRWLRDDCRRLAERGESNVPTLAIVGKVGEGKSWLARCFLTDHPDNSPTIDELPSGENASDRSRRLTWFGPERPFGLAPGEQFLQVPSSRLLDLGRPYIAGDTPGFSDCNPAAAELSRTAVSSAAVKIVVFSAKTKGDEAITDFVRLMDGALILPVVGFKPDNEEQTQPSAETVQEIESLLAHWRSEVQAASVLSPCYMPMESVFGTQRACALMKTRLAESLRPYLGDLARLRRSIEDQIRQRIQMARRDAAALLEEVHRRLWGFVTRLGEITQRLPDQLLQELLGEDLVLRAGVRQRFRAEWLDCVPAVFFPYRSLAGLLVLTAGAWEKLIFALSGSMPSLAMTFFQVFQNLRDATRFQRRTRDELVRRVEQTFEKELHDELRNFRTAVAALRPENEATECLSAPSAARVTAEGLEHLEAESRRILRDAIEHHQASGVLAWLIGLVAALLFWGLLAGPIVALYGGYLRAWWQTIILRGASWTAFPTPEWSMLGTSLLFSTAPAFILALVGLGWCCNSGRVRRTVAAIREQHLEMLSRQLGGDALRIDVADPQLEAARFLGNLCAVAANNHGIKRQ